MTKGKSMCCEACQGAGIVISTLSDDGEPLHFVRCLVCFGRGWRWSGVTKLAVYNLQNDLR